LRDQINFRQIIIALQLHIQLAINLYNKSVCLALQGLLITLARTLRSAEHAGRQDSQHARPAAVLRSYNMWQVRYKHANGCACHLCID